MAQRRPQCLEERGRFMIIEESILQTGWDEVVKAPVGFFLSSPSASTATSAHRDQNRARIRSRGGSHAASRSSTPAPPSLHPGSEPGSNSVHTSPGGAVGAGGQTPPSLPPEALKECMKQFYAAYAALNSMKSNLGNMGRSIGIPNNHQPQHGFLSDDFQRSLGLEGLGVGMDSKPHQSDEKTGGVGGDPVPAGPPSGGMTAGPGVVVVSPTVQSAVGGTTNMGGADAGGGGTGTQSFQGEGAAERSLKAELETTLAAKRKLVFELKHAKEEAESLKKNNVVLEQKIARMLQNSVIGSTSLDER